MKRVLRKSRETRIMLPSTSRLSGGERWSEKPEGGVMGFWAFREKVVPGPPSGSDALLSEQVAAALPLSYEAVGEALFDGRSATDACEVVGRQLGARGVSLEE